MFYKFLPKFQILNDINKIDYEATIQDVVENTRFSLSFVFLLISSNIICTLGLLLNSTPIVIGGMIISPLMWPLMKLATGITYEKVHFVRKSIILLVLSISISLLTAGIITIISPIKVINDEILSRTYPTLLDLIVGLFAGGVAALALTQPRISNTLSGVAIATSLLPPLCVSGIGIALLNTNVFFGGFLLFIANIIAILLASVLLFYLVGFKKNSHLNFTIKGIVYITIVLFLIIIPLFFLMKNYSFRLSSYNRVQNILQKEFNEISSSIYVNGIKTSMPFYSPEIKEINIQADILIPEEVNINYIQQQQIIGALERELQRKVNLELRMQQTISVVSKTSLEEENLKQAIKKFFVETLQNKISSLTIDKLELFLNGNKVEINTILKGDPSTYLTYNEQAAIEDIIAIKFNRKVSLNIEIIPRINLRSKPEIEQDEMKKELEKKVLSISKEISVGNFNIQRIEDSKNLIIDFEIKKPEELNIEKEQIEEIKKYLEKKYDNNIALNIAFVNVELMQIDKNEGGDKNGK